MMKAKNLIKNGGFEEPSLGNTWKILDKLDSWDLSPNVEIGLGSIYNENWKTGQVAELDSDKNTSISQKFNTPKASLCVVKFDYLSRTGDESSSMKVSFNNKTIFEGFANDKALHQYQRTVLCQKGENLIKFEGTGSSNSYGITIDNVSVQVTGLDSLAVCLK